MSYTSLLNKTCNVQEKTTAYSTTGSPTVTFANKDTDVKCGIQPTSGRLVSAEYAERNNITHDGFFNIGQDIVKGDKVVVGSTEYIVKRVFDAAGRAHHFEVLLELAE